MGLPVALKCLVPALGMVGCPTVDGSASCCGLLSCTISISMSISISIRCPPDEIAVEGLLVVQVLVPAAAEEAYSTRILKFARDHLADTEVRVRNAVADVLGVLASTLGIALWDACREEIISNIKFNFVRFCCPSILASW
jgi:hypothetical protein